MKTPGTENSIREWLNDIERHGLLYEKGECRSVHLVIAYYSERAARFPKDKIRLDDIVASFDNFKSIAESYERYEVCSYLQDAIDWMQTLDSIQDVFKIYMKYELQKMIKLAAEAESIHNPDYLIW